MRNRDRDEVIRVVSTRYFNLTQKKGAQRSSQPPEHAFFSSERGDRSGARRGRGRNRGGGRGSSRGGNSNGGGGHSSSSSASSTGNNGASSSEGGSGGGSCTPDRCRRCRRRDHRNKECITKETDFVPRCARGSGFGHEESACPSDATILVMKLLDNDSEDEKVLAAKATGKCSLRIDGDVRDGELDDQVAQYIADSGATFHLTPDADGLTNFREGSRPLGLADRKRVSIAGYGDLTVAFRSNDSWYMSNCAMEGMSHR